MNFRSGLFTGLLIASALAGLAFLGRAAIFPQRKGADTAKPPAASTVTKALKEDELLTFSLSAKAVERLKVETTEVKLAKNVHRTRTFGGEVTIPPGQTFLVSSPLGGILRGPATGVPKPGATLEQGQAVFELSPFLSPDAKPTLIAARVDAEGQVETAQSTHDAAKIMFVRADQLFRDQAGSKAAVDTAQAQVDLAKKTLDAAKARLELLKKVVAEADRGTATPIAITAPAAGLLRVVSARPGQSVPSGAALFEIADLSQVWVRVPVFVGEAEALNSASATIAPLTARPGPNRKEAKSVAAPPSANPLTGTVDLYFQLPNADGAYRPGQRVGVAIPLVAESEALTVPWKAVFVDVNGGTWVYEALADNKYIRRRVDVRHVDGATAILKAGPPDKTRIVATGVQELFGVEVGYAK